MKRIISAVLLLFFCTGICVYGSLTAERKTDLLITLLDEAEYSINTGNTAKALQSLARLEKEWENAEKFFSSVSETALIDELDISLGSIEKYIKSDKNDEAVIIIEQCRTGLETVLKRQKISIDNILQLSPSGRLLTDG